MGGMKKVSWITILYISIIFSFGGIANAARDQDGFVSTDNTQARLVRLETKLQLKFDELEKALILARQLIEKDKEIATINLNNRLESMNEFRSQMNKAESTYATKDLVETRISELERLVYIGVGLVLAIQFFLILYINSRKNSNK